MTTISWTHNPATGGRGATWNPVTGCSAISTGCLNCYAVKMTRRLARIERTRSKYAGLVSDVHFTGKVLCHEDVLQKPLKVRQPTTFFVNSMSDTFHPKVPVTFVRSMFHVMEQCPQHLFLLLTKRPERVPRVLGPNHARIYEYEGPVPCPQSNIWLGTSVENQAACVRIEDLIRCPAAVRFLSVEPMLERISFFGQYDKGLEWDMFGLAWSKSNCRYERIRDPGIHQIIIGGESGPKARPFNLEWAYDLIDQCRTANVAVFVKQLGSCARLQGEPYPRQHPDDRGNRTDPRFWPKPLQIQEYPK